MITSDAHEGIIHAISEVFPTVPWQRYQFHFSRNIADKTPKKYQTGIRAELQEMCACNTLKEARNKKNQIIQEYQDVAKTAMSCLDEGGKCYDSHDTATRNATILPYFECC